jgi:hypothetical protein
MIGKFLEVAEEADELVAHNGNHFDLKWFNTQCLAHGYTPLTEPKTVDTLAMARKHFYLNSNRLDYIAKFLFGKGKDSPNYDVWKRIVLDNYPAALAEMVDYCKQDVRLLERVYDRIKLFHKPATHVGVMAGKARWTCSHCGSGDVRRKKKRATTKGTIQHSMACGHCRGHYTISDTVYKEFGKARI